MMFRRLIVLVSLIALAGNGFAEPDGRAERRIHLWGGQASIVRPEGVRIQRSKENRNRYTLTSKGTKVRVVIERGLIPSKYRAASTDRMGREARSRLRKQGYRVESHKSAGRTVRIVFSGSDRKTIQSPNGRLDVQVPWVGYLRWLRQANHRTYQSVVLIPEPVSDLRAAATLKRAASSLAIPPMKRPPADRLKDLAGGLPVVWGRAGSWLPSWRGK